MNPFEEHNRRREFQRLQLITSLRSVTRMLRTVAEAYGIDDSPVVCSRIQRAEKLLMEVDDETVRES